MLAYGLVLQVSPVDALMRGYSSQNDYAHWTCPVLPSFRGGHLVASISLSFDICAGSSVKIPVTVLSSSSPGIASMAS